MAKRNETDVEVKRFNATAKQFIKYNGEYLGTGDKFQVKESDVKELSKYADIDIPEERLPLDGQEGEEAGE